MVPTTRGKREMVLCAIE